MDQDRPFISMGSVDLSTEARRKTLQSKRPNKLQVIQNWTMRHRTLSTRAHG
uniref:Uncharacterized protein n=1 Tax=Zea mays TaxID=4577 RepID=C4J8H7_MAIZE|nr:unknown [Zea mays]